MNLQSSWVNSINQLFISIISLVIATNLAWAADGHVKLLVIDAISQKPVENAVVSIANLTVISHTDSKGLTLLKNIPAGVHDVLCTAAGYEGLVKKQIHIQNDADVEVTCVLKPYAATNQNESKIQHPAVLFTEQSLEAEITPRSSSSPSPESRNQLSMKLRKPNMALNPYLAGGISRSYANADIAESAAAMEQTIPNTEQYDKIDDAPFKPALQVPVSTFSIDVDTASYSNARRYLEREGRLPPKDAVRIEEFINYFSYNYPEPVGEHPLAISTEISTAPWNLNNKLVQIGLQTKKLATAALPASNLVFLIDVSGSMYQSEKLPLLKKAFKLLVNNLRKQDRVAIVVYAGSTGLVLPSTSAINGEKIFSILNQLGAGGSTAGGEGIKLAYKVARENFIRGGNNRIILATDGDFNVGPSSNSELIRLIEAEREHGTFLTILGFGRGNYKDSLMEQLSNKGNGNAAYIDSLPEAKKVLVAEMGGTLLTVAKDVKIQVEFNPARVKGYRLIGYENRALADQDFNDDKKDAGELGAGHSVTVLYEIIPAGSKQPLPGIDKLKYQNREVTATANKYSDLLTLKLRYKRPNENNSNLIVKALTDTSTSLDQTSQSFRFAAAVAEFGMLLRDSKYKGNASFDAVIQRASMALGEDVEGYRAGFLKLVKLARSHQMAQ